MIVSSHLLRCLLGAIVVGAAGFLSADLHAQGVFKKPSPGEIYKEYMQIISVGSNDWRVTDPTINLETYPAASEFLPNPTLYIGIDDLDGATRAEALFDIWGGHIGTTGKQVSFNGNSWITIPELQTPPTDPYNYLHQAIIGVDVPLSHLHTGTNSFTGTNAGQTGPYGFGWGQFGWYSIVLRVYYNPASKSHVTGSISSPGAGSSFGDNPTVSVQVNGSASRVDVLAYYDGDDSDGDGIYTEYHHDYHRGIYDDVAIRNHVGTDYSSQFAVTWDNSWVPDQSGIKLLARVQGDNGVWYVTPEVTGLTLSRSASSVRLFKPFGVDEREWARGDLGDPAGTQQSYVNISDLTGATSAVFFARTWNGIDGLGDPDHYTRVNGWYAPSYGVSHYFSYDLLSVPVGSLQGGTNLMEFKSNTIAHHGIEVIWPGSAIAVRYGTPVPITLASFNAAVLKGDQVLVQWTTLSETNNYGFEVERAAGQPANFQTIPGSFVAGAGTTLDPKSYSFMDPLRPAGVVYYRLKQIDLDGSVRYFEPFRLDATTAVADKEIPKSYALHQAYPNPFNPSTRIPFSIPVSGHVRIRVFNHLGQSIRELVNEFRTAGSHEVQFDVDGLPSGHYYYVMESGPFIDAKKVVLLR